MSRTTDERITTIARIIGRIQRHPLVPADVQDAMHMLVLILGELDTRITELERVNNGDGRQAR